MLEGHAMRADPEPIREAPCSRRPSGRTRRAVPLLLTLLVGLTAGALVHVRIRLQQIHTGYALSQQRRTAHELTQAQKRLRIEAAVLKHPARIERIARTRLGMAPPEPTAIHVVRVPRVAASPPVAGPAPVVATKAPAHRVVGRAEPLPEPIAAGGAP
jgi:cell division protein FtsL